MYLLDDALSASMVPDDLDLQLSLREIQNKKLAIIRLLVARKLMKNSFSCLILHYACPFFRLRKLIKLLQDPMSR